MLRIPPVQYHTPSEVSEALDILADHGADAMLVAGGTDVYPGMKRRIFTPGHLVSLTQIEELKEFQSNGTLTLGAGLTLSRVAADPVIQNRYPALARAAGLVSTPQLRNMGTIGGNVCLDTRCNYYNQSENWREALGYCMKKDGDICWVAPGSSRCWAVNSSDTAPVLIALGATAHLAGTAGERRIPVEELFRDDGINYLQKSPDEILVHLHLPEPQGLRTAYHKLRRRGSIDFPILGVAVALRLAEDGTCSEANIILNAIASRPLRAADAEAALIGQPLTEQTIEEAARLAYQPAKPLDNTDMTLSYRKQMVPVFVSRALKEAGARKAERMA